MIVSLLKKHVKAVVNEIINLHAYFGVELSSRARQRGNWKLHRWPFVELTKIGGIDSKKTIRLFWEVQIMKWRQFNQQPASAIELYGTFYNNFTLNRKFENHTNLRKKLRFSSIKTIKKQNQRKKMCFPVAPWLRLCFLYTKQMLTFYPWNM